MRAIEFGIDISSSGFNLFLAGAPGTGRKTISAPHPRGQASKGRPTPPDIAYVHNFADPDTPRVLVMTAGKGARLRDDLKELVEDLQELIPKAFDGKAYEEQQRTTGERFQSKKQDPHRWPSRPRQRSGDSRSRARRWDSAPFPCRDDKPLTQEEYQDMPEDEREELDSRMEDLQAHIREVMSEVKDVDHALREDLRELNRQVAMNVLGTLMLDIGRGYRDLDGVSEHLRPTRAGCAREHRAVSSPRRSGVAADPGPQDAEAGARPEPVLQVNLVVDNVASLTAPR